VTLQDLAFDLNGVLWWDSHLQERAWKRFSRGIRGTPLSEEEMAVHVHGRNNGHTLEYLLGRAPGAREVRELTQRKGNHLLTESGLQRCRRIMG
jgi:beta-phosphoglucomutase